MKKALILIVMIFGINNLNAEEYASNKKYSFQEVAEILSEKIIEDREKIVALQQEVETLKMQLKNTETGVMRKINDTNRSVMDIKEVQIKNNIKGSDSNQKVSNETMRNIEISTELYNKVK